MEENKKEELQTRRSFFKSAAQKAMPFVAFTTLGGILASCEDDPDSPSGCGKTCSGSCDGDCAGDCDDGCWTACIAACVKFQR